MIKYKRFQKLFQLFDAGNEIQEFLNELTTDGWKIIYYNENVTRDELNIVVLVGKTTTI